MNAIPAIICAKCGKPTPKRAAMQLYCTKCSGEVDGARRYKRKREVAWSPSIERGLAISANAARRSLIDRPGDGSLSNKAWFVSFKVPYSQAASKNFVWGIGAGGGHVFKRQQSRDYQGLIESKVRDSVAGTRVFNNKVWVDLFVQKPNHKSDAINVISVICDGIKKGIGLDDRWFSIQRVDWEIAKSDPQIFISIFQLDEGDVQACSHCGRLLPFSDFNKKSSTKLGVDRACKDCRNSNGSRRNA